MKRLAASKTPLTMCPLSNLKLGVIKDMKDHPLRTLMEKGLMVTVNSDDPAYFGGYENENYQAVQAALDLTQDHMRALARNSFEASFLRPSEKQKLIAQLDEYQRSISMTVGIIPEGLAPGVSSRLHRRAGRNAASWGARRIS